MRVSLYCSCGSCLVRDNPVVPVAELERLWNKAHPAPAHRRVGYWEWEDDRRERQAARAKRRKRA